MCYVHFAESMPRSTKVKVARKKFYAFKRPPLGGSRQVTSLGLMCHFVLSLGCGGWSGRRRDISREFTYMVGASTEPTVLGSTLIYLANVLSVCLSVCYRLQARQLDY